MLYKGSYHCGRVAFEVEGDLTRVTECNCSICSRKGSLLWFVPRERLRLLTSETNLRSYTFGARTIEQLLNWIKVQAEAKPDGEWIIHDKHSH